jgi:cysteine desulfurase/selenocysteine lyase
LDVKKIRADFPILQKTIKGKPIVYFDSSCVTLKPRQVTQAMAAYYEDFTACHGRSIHAFSQKTTEAFEKARETVARFINAQPKECIWTRNTTEGINLIAYSLGFKSGDKVVTTNMEHNSNLLPWMRLVQKSGVKHEMTLVRDGEFDIEDFKKRVDSKTKLVSVVHTSNVTGTTTPAKEICEIAHDKGALVLLDGAQSAPHRRIDVKKINADFFAFSGHKMLGPSGMGVLFGKYELLQKMEPFLLGGETVKNVRLDTGYELEEPPAKFEAGLQNYAGAIGMGAAAKYLMDVGMDEVEKYEHELAKALLDGFAKYPQISIVGPKDPMRRGAIAAFSIKGIHPHDVALLLDESSNIFLRSGAHCTHMYHQDFLKLMEGTVRPSLYIYNTKEEIAFFFEKLAEVVKYFT